MYFPMSQHYLCIKTIVSEYDFLYVEGPCGHPRISLRSEVGFPFDVPLRYLQDAAVWHPEPYTLESFAER